MTNNTFLALAPEELRQVPQWVCWKREERDGKPTKIPYRADGKGMASTTDPTTWASHEAALEAYQARRYDGIGFVFTANDPYTGVDLDHCRDPQTGEIENWAQTIIGSLNSYSEVTPSGTGVHIIIKAKLPTGGNRKGKIEFYDRARYFTITGNHLDETPDIIEDRQRELNDLHARTFPKATSVNKPGGDGPHPVALSDAELISKAMAATNGDAFRGLWNGDTSSHGGDDSAADLALCCHLAFWTGNDPARIDSLFRQSGLYREKWERQDYRERTITKAIESTAKGYSRAAREPYPTVFNNTYKYIPSGQNETEAKGDRNGTHIGTTSLQKEPKDLSRFEGLSKRVRAWVENTGGWWETRELDSDLGISGPRDKENRKKILQRLHEQGIIEPHQKINKQWRYVNTRVTSLDFKTASTAGIFPIKWPMGIEKKVNLFPGNLVVVAGSPNAGKTAFNLHFIYLNQKQFPINYICSEMGAVELRNRLEQFPGMAIEEWSFKAVERATDFADVIVPDTICIIDYLEMTNELYEVNTHLTAISHKVGSGLAIVSIQKKINAQYGRGQEFSLEKPKLYLSLDRGVMRIVKAKSWAMKNVDPHGLEIHFKIVGGCLFEPSGDWDWKH